MVQHVHPLPTATALARRRGRVYWTQRRRRGPAVAVKVQRPGVRAVVQADMAALRRATRWLARLQPKFNALIDLRAMFDLVFDAVRGALDFTVEARNMELGRLATAGSDHLTVPAVIRATPRVLVQDLAPGRSIRDAAPEEFSLVERLGIAHDLLAFMYRGYFVERTFHADPHPGIVFVAPGRPAAPTASSATYPTASRSCRSSRATASPPP